MIVPVIGGRQLGRAPNVQRYMRIMCGLSRRNVGFSASNWLLTRASPASRRIVASRGRFARAVRAPVQRPSGRAFCGYGVSPRASLATRSAMRRARVSGRLACVTR